MLAQLYLVFGVAAAASGEVSGAPSDDLCAWKGAAADGRRHRAYGRKYTTMRRAGKRHSTGPGLMRRW